MNTANDSETAERSPRVIQWATGSVGTHSLRAIIRRPDLDLVGVRVFNPDKVGVDAGTLVGEPHTGVAATDDTEHLMALGADCVVYNALAETTPDAGDAAVAEICTLLDAGLDVCSTAVSHHVHPAVMLPHHRDQISAACDRGRASFFSSGVNPGFAFDFLPAAISHLAEQVDCVVCTEIADMVGYSSMSAMSFMGFGVPPDEPAPIVNAHADPYRSAYRASALVLAGALRVELDDLTFHRDVAVTDTAFDIAAGRIEAGTVAATRLVFRGIRRGRVVLEYRVVWRVSNDVAPEWGVGDGAWLVDIEGDPELHCRLDVTTRRDSGRAVSIATAMEPVNAIPAVVAAAPGIHTHLDLPFYGGGNVGDR